MTLNSLGNVVASFNSFYPDGSRRVALLTCGDALCNSIGWGAVAVGDGVVSTGSCVALRSGTHRPVVAYVHAPWLHATDCADESCVSGASRDYVINNQLPAAVANVGGSPAVGTDTVNTTTFAYVSSVNGTVIISFADQNYTYTGRTVTTIPTSDRLTSGAFSFHMSATPTFATISSTAGLELVQCASVTCGRWMRTVLDSAAAPAGGCSVRGLRVAYMTSSSLMLGFVQ